MVRRIASQVHKQASRLLLQKYIKREPAWFQAVLDHPPLPLPARAPADREDYDLAPHDTLGSRTAPAKRMRPDNRRPLPISYIEDEVRRQFFTDHPFEAFRARSLLEDGEVEPEHPINGAKWTRLRQRGRNPSSEDAIRFAVNLHDHHGVRLTDAYAAAVAQFRALRAEHEMATQVAQMEAEYYGIYLGESMAEKNFQAEERALATWKQDAQQDAMANIARKRWRMVPEKVGTPGTWTRGQEYVRLWQEGVRPSYSPMLETPPIAPGSIEQPKPSESTLQQSLPADRQNKLRQQIAVRAQAMRARS